MKSYSFFAFTIIAAAFLAPQITHAAITSPMSTDRWNTGETKAITWDQSVFTSTNLQIGWSNGPGSLNWINSSTPNTGSYSWDVKTGNYGIDEDLFTIKIFGQSSDGQKILTSDEFTVIQTRPSMAFTSPISGTTFEKGDTIDITWTQQYVDTVDLSYRCEGGSVQSVLSNSPATTTHTITAPDCNSISASFDVYLSGRSNEFGYTTGDSQGVNYYTRTITVTDAEYQDPTQTPTPPTEPEPTPDPQDTVIIVNEYNTYYETNVTHNNTNKEEEIDEFEFVFDTLDVDEEEINVDPNLELAQQAFLKIVDNVVPANKPQTTPKTNPSIKATSTTDGEPETQNQEEQIEETEETTKDGEVVVEENLTWWEKVKRFFGRIFGK